MAQVQEQLNELQRDFDEQSRASGLEPSRQLLIDQLVEAGFEEVAAGSRDEHSREKEWFARATTVDVFSAAADHLDAVALRGLLEERLNYRVASRVLQEDLVVRVINENPNLTREALAKAMMP